jgi:hypothetical protein
VRLALLAEAESELDDAAAWYDDQRPGLGDELLAVDLAKPRTPPTLICSP